MSIVGLSLKRYTGLTIEIQNSGLVDSLVCGSRGETLFDHQFLSARKQCERHFRLDLPLFHWAPIGPSAFRAADPVLSGRRTQRRGLSLIPGMLAERLRFGLLGSPRVAIESFGYRFQSISHGGSHRFESYSAHHHLRVRSGEIGNSTGHPFGVVVRI